MSSEQAANVEEPDDSLFRIKLYVTSREFRNQTSGPNLGVWEIRCDTGDEFLEKLWEKTRPIIKREIIRVNDEEFQWSPEENVLSVDDMDR